jgi:glutamine amidotransferase
MVVIVDYGMANLRSVQKAVEKCGCSAQITSDPLQVGKAERLILPGVGAFRDAIAKLRQTGLDRPIIDHVQADKPFLGICLGLQLLFSVSYEDGVHEGLNLFPGKVVAFDPSVGKVPHMGWNVVKPPFLPEGATVQKDKERGRQGDKEKEAHDWWRQALSSPSPCLPLSLSPCLPDPAWMYFVHSYYVVPDAPSLVALECDYGGPFCAAIAKGRLFATQFHPEKSQRAGLWLLHKFLTLC